MTTPALYDLTPLLRLMFMGVVLALGPLAWVWLRHSAAGTHKRLQALTLLTLFLTFDLVLFGAFTRLTDSGLGCPDWPGCYGHASPVGAQRHIEEAQSALPSGPVTHSKAWVEMIHRYLATAVGVLILVLALASWLARWRAGQQRAKSGGVAAAHSGAQAHLDQEVVSPWWPTLTLLWVCVQGAFGALTVTMKLFPAIVTLHLLGGLLLLALLCVQAVRYAQMQPQASASTSVQVSPGLRRLLSITLMVLIAQIALGAWVSTNYAVLACAEFPKCQGQWWPPMNFSQGFELWRELGLQGNGQPLDFAALTAIHYVHRLMAYVLLALLAVLAWRMKTIRPWAQLSNYLTALLALQFATGLSNVLLDWPLLSAVLHTGGAAALVLVLTWAGALLRVPKNATNLVAPPSAPRITA